MTIITLLPYFGGHLEFDTFGTFILDVELLLQIKYDRVFRHSLKRLTGVSSDRVIDSSYKHVNTCSCIYNLLIEPIYHSDHSRICIHSVLSLLLHITIN